MYIGRCRVDMIILLYHMSHGHDVGAIWDPPWLDVRSIDDSLRQLETQGLREFFR